MSLTSLDFQVDGVGEITEPYVLTAIWVCDDATNATSLDAVPGFLYCSLCGVA